VKSDGDFEDILAEDNPDIWRSDRPAKSGETGAMLAQIIEKAAAIKAARRASKGSGRGRTAHRRGAR
jgi:hypothetical protein